MRRQEQGYEDDNDDLNVDDHEYVNEDDEDLEEDDYQLSSSSVILAALNQSSLGVHSSNPTHHCGSR